MAQTPAPPPARRPDQPQYGHVPSPYAPLAAPPGNWFAIPALVLGIVGTVVGLAPLLYKVALACGTLAFIFGIAGRPPSTRAGAPNRRMATAAIILGVIAVALGIIGRDLVIHAFPEPAASWL